MNHPRILKETRQILKKLCLIVTPPVHKVSKLRASKTVEIDKLFNFYSMCEAKAIYEKRTFAVDGTFEARW